MIPYYEVNLIKKYDKPLLQKSETEVCKQKKKNHRILVQSQQAKELGRFEIKLDNVWIANNEQIFAVKLLANLVVASNCHNVLNMLANQSLLNGALVMKIVNNSFSESKENFSRLIKRKNF